MDEPRDISYGPEKREDREKERERGREREGEREKERENERERERAYECTLRATNFPLSTFLVKLQVHPCCVLSSTTYFDSLEPVLLVAVVAVERGGIKRKTLASIALDQLDKVRT